MVSRARRNGRSTNLATLAAGGLVLCVVLGAHYEVLTYWFTGSDTLTLIEKSRMRSVEEAITVLTSPLMYGTNFSIIVALFYRPVANLSYALDSWLWGLDLFGYHLTGLLLHGSVACLPSHSFAGSRKTPSRGCSPAVCSQFTRSPPKSFRRPPPARRARDDLRPGTEALPTAANTYEESDLPPRSVIAIVGIPHRPGSPGVVAKRPQARTIAYFYANTVASWIRLTPIAGLRRTSGSRWFRSASSQSR